MNLNRPQLIPRAAFKEVLEGFVSGTMLEDLPELTTIDHATLGPLTVVLFENPDFVLVARGAFEDRR